MRIAVIDKDSCAGKKCSICVGVCPMNRLKKECIVMEDFPKINEEICSGCGICVRKCPAKAISIVNLAEEVGEPFHQYGINSFRLFGFFVPKEGVTAIIGQNGAGKSTAVKILAKKMKPKKYGRELSYEEIAREFKGTEIGNFFKKLEGMKISYKPQNVEEFEKVSFGGVERKVSELSGGELQKILIEKTLSEDAEIYIFDEPSSFLDIKQRLEVAKKIREKAKEKKVIVVEHDLAILDYLADYVYVIYGEAGTYGIFSNVKSSRVGINEFLDGYLKSENVRIRSEEIKFDLTGIERTEGIGEVFFTYGTLEKNYENFSLHVDAGEIREGEIIGIIGENSIGKTTFVKLIAGVEKPTNCEIKEKRKISYKPQYLKPPKGKVKDIISTIIEEKEKEKEEKEPILNFIEKIMEKECQKLSGGELQKLAIAVCLLQDAEIYLLDEPSAYLDIEERLNLSKILRRTIKKGKCAFVVDHDLVFIDSISDRIILFNGIPGKRGIALRPTSKKDAMNSFLKKIGITMRRDKDTKRPRINKEGSSLDREQKETGNYYYPGE
ncbi:MAG: ribosome biogenesis/translation initiation ATPase RLI [Candidatus Micrarchaeia archaeon]